MKKDETMEDIFAIADAERLKDIEDWESKGGLERVRAKMAHERQRLIDQGIIDEDGNSLVEETEEDEEIEDQDD